MEKAKLLISIEPVDHLSCQLVTQRGTNSGGVMGLRAVFLRSTTSLFTIWNEPVYQTLFSSRFSIALLWKKLSVAIML